MTVLIILKNILFYCILLLVGTIVLIEFDCPRVFIKTIHILTYFYIACKCVIEVIEKKKSGLPTGK